MSSREISIWIDERWYDALSRYLKDETLEEHLEEVIDQLCNQLPEHEYESISHQLWQEQQERIQEREASRRFAVFHTIEHGEESHFQVERNLEMMDAARLLRAYMKGETAAETFKQTIHNAQDITADEFRFKVQERLDNTGKITGAFELDFDKQQFSALHIMDGWKCYTMKDISNAIYHADRKDYISRDARWERFLDRITGKELGYEPHGSENKHIEGSCRLKSNEISVDGEVMWSHEILEFYVPIHFDPCKVFGSEIASAPAGSHVNVYAYYDLEKQAVRDDLTVLLYHDNGPDKEFRYTLSAEEKELFRDRMNEICIKCGAGLEECRQEYLREEAEAHGQAMQM